MGEEVLFNIVDCYLPLVVDVPALDDLGEERPHDRRELLGVGVGEDVQGRPVRQRPDHRLFKRSTFETKQARVRFRANEGT